MQFQIGGRIGSRQVGWPDPSGERPEQPKLNNLRARSMELAAALRAELTAETIDEKVQALLDPTVGEYLDRNRR